MLGVAFLDIPVGIRLFYGFFETLVIFQFILTYLHLEIRAAKLIAMVTCCVLFVLFIRYIAGNNIFIVMMGGMLCYIFFIWLFTSIIGPQVIISIAICYSIILIIEPIAYICIYLPFYNNGNYIYIWILSVLPNIVLIMSAKTILKRVKGYHGKGATL